MPNNKIENLPDFKECNATLQAYFAIDKETITEEIQGRYKAVASEINMLPLRFFGRFINEKASLFSNSFNRMLSVEDEIQFNVDELTLAEIWAERYLHMLKKAAIQINFDGKKVSFEALDANMYFYDKQHDVWYLNVSDTKTLAYVKTKVTTKPYHDDKIQNGSVDYLGGSLGTTQDRFDASPSFVKSANEITNIRNMTKPQGNNEQDSLGGDYVSNNSQIIDDVVESYEVKIYESTSQIDFASTLKAIDYNKTWEANNFVFSGDVLDDFPFVEWSYYRIKTAVPHELADLQTEYIEMLSWGFFNVAPKLLTQVIIKSNEDEMKLQSELKNFGRTTSAVRVGLTDEILVFDTGDIKVLSDLLTNYSTILEQQALAEGVDKNAVVAQSRIESGEAKKTELAYINKARNEYKIPARLFEQAIIDKVKDLYNINISYDGIVFRDLELVSDPVNDIEIATAMFVNHFWTYEQTYAYIHKVTLDKAKEMIKELGLTAPDPLGVRTQVNDTFTKTGLPAPEKVNFKAKERDPLLINQDIKSN